MLLARLSAQMVDPLHQKLVALGVAQRRRHSFASACLLSLARVLGQQRVPRSVSGAPKSGRPSELFVTDAVDLALKSVKIVNREILAGCGIRNC